MERDVKINNDTKHSESEQFNDYLSTMERTEKAEFIKYLAFTCGVSRPVVYSWKYMCSRIPQRCKEIIERAAGQKIFT